MRKVLIALLIAVAGAAPITAMSVAPALAEENQGSDSGDVADDDSSNSEQEESKASGRRDDSSSKQERRDDRQERVRAHRHDRQVRVRAHNDVPDQQKQPHSSSATSDATSLLRTPGQRGIEMSSFSTGARRLIREMFTLRDASSAPTSPSSPTSDSPDINLDLLVGAAVSEAGFLVDSEESMTTALSEPVALLDPEESLTEAVLTTAVVAAAELNQCNGVETGEAAAVECDVTVTNNLDLDTGETSSTVVVRVCQGAPGEDLEAMDKCTTTITSSDELTTTITQCNDSANAGGSTVTCTVHVINNITGTATTTPVTVNQCNGSGGGGGTEPTTLCDPFPANTTNATVTQCNGSGNNGGGTMRVKCTVLDGSTETSVLPITVDQCNGSANGGGDLVTCTVSIENNIIAGTGGGDDDTPSGGDDDTPSGGDDDTPSGGDDDTPSGGDDSPSAGSNSPSGAGATPLGGIDDGRLARGDSQVLAAGASELNGKEVLPATGLDVRVPVQLGVLMLLLGTGLMRLSRSMRPRRVGSALLTGRTEDLGTRRIDLRVTPAPVRDLPRRT